jgi:hypothetical protein
MTRSLPLWKAFHKGKYGKVVVMRRCSSKTVQRQGSGGMKLSITTGCQESGDRRLLAET